MEILQYWGLEGEAVTLIHQSEHNSTWDVGGRYVLQKGPARYELANLLRLQGIPVAVYVKTAEGGYTSPCGEFCLMEKLSGKHIPFAGAAEIVRELGRGLARLHLSFSAVSGELDCHDNDFLAEWNGWIKEGLSCVPKDLVAWTEDKLFSLYGKLPRCPIHRDVHSKNVLFENGKISGWLDFDLNRVDVRVFDLAYILAGVFIEEIDLSAYQALLDGYNEISPLSQEETDAIPVLVIAIELLFVTYWGDKNLAGRDNALALAEQIFSRFKEGF